MYFRTAASWKTHLLAFSWLGQRAYGKSRAADRWLLAREFSDLACFFLVTARRVAVGWVVTSYDSWFLT